MADQNTLTAIATEIGQALEPLSEALVSPAHFATFVRELGWELSTIPAPIGAIAGPVEDLLSVLSAGDPDLDSLPKMVSAIGSVFTAIRAITTQPGAFPDTVDPAEFVADFPTQLVDYVVVEHLLNRRAEWGELLRTAGVIRLVPTEATATRPAYVRRVFGWSDLVKVMTEPGTILRQAWKYGEAAFADSGLLDAIAELSAAWDVPGRYDPYDPVLREHLAPGAGAPTPAEEWLLRVPFVTGYSGTKRIEMGIAFALVPGTNAAPFGFAIMPYAVGLDIRELPLTDGVTLTFDSGVDLTEGLAIILHPGQPTQVRTKLFGSGPAAAGPDHYSLGLTVGSGDGKAIRLFGSSNGSRFEFESASLRAGVHTEGEGKSAVFVEVSLQKARVVFKPSSDSDGFLTKIIPGDGLTGEFDLTVGLSSGAGLYFAGSGGLEVRLPVQLSLGPLGITGATVAVRPTGDTLPIETTLDAKGKLGPLTAAIEGVGLEIELSFPPGGDGMFGPVDLQLGFKPPKGVGLSLDAGVVVGGGFLSADPDRGEYAGILVFSLAGLVTVQAIGLITTRMPDGSKGFSLLIILTAEFAGGGIQLGFGFTLLAVGGLIGLNRRMDLDALVRGIETNAIESVMFPRDVIANAPRILSDLRAFFPPSDGTFLIGPMLKIGWGTPTLLSISVGVIMEIPGNIAIVGILKAALPSVDAPLLILQVNFIGALEFDKERFWFYAKLFDSRILFMSIDGGMGILIGWGGDANVVLSVGGFHPAFTPPPLPFPVPERISIDILNSPGRLIRVSGYFAVTSNTVQFGAKAELRLGFSGFGIEGHLSFDALFRFSPFSFIIEISAGISLKAFGVGLFSIDLHFVLEGPTPWRAHGRGSISLLFFEISANFDITWGEERDTTLPPIDIIPLLEAEIAKIEGWETRLPAGGNLLVSLRTLPDTELVLHPMGTLSIRQRALPLDLALDKVGAQTPRDANRLSVRVTTVGLTKRTDLDDKFAIAQFQDMDDAAKLSRAAFENQHAGLEIGPAGSLVDSAYATRRSARYETNIIDTEHATPQPPNGLTAAGAAGQPSTTRSTHQDFSPTLFKHFLAGSSTSRSPLSDARSKLSQPFRPAETLAVTGERFTIAHTKNNTPSPIGSGGGGDFASVNGVYVEFGSESAAHDFLTRYLANNPGSIGSLHVIPTAEVPEPAELVSADREVVSR